MFQLSFLNTGLLILAAATVLPLIIWLLAKKKPPSLVFSSIRFIKNTEKEQKNRTKLKNILLLIIRMLIILLVVLAAGRPALRIPGLKPAKTHPPTAIAIILDTSYSMDVLYQGKSILEHAKTAILQINKRLTPQDLCVLVTSDDSWNRLNSQLYQGKVPENLVRGIKSTWLPLTMDKLTAYAEAKLSESQFSNREIYLLTDGQDQTLPDKVNVPMRLIPLKKAGIYENVAVIKAEPMMQLTSRTENQLISFDIVNYGSSVRRDILVRVDFNGVKTAEKFVTLQPYQRLQDTLPVQITQSGWQSGYIEILDENLPADNRCWFAFRYDLHPNLAVITERPALPLILQTFLSVYATAQGSVRLIAPNQVNWQQLKDYSILVVYDGGELSPRLREFLQECTKANKGVLYIADKELTADWKSWYGQRFGVRFGQYESRAVPLTYVNKYHPITTLIDERQIRQSSVSGFWSVSATGSSNILLAAENSGLALAEGSSLLWTFDPAVMQSSFLLNAAFPVFAFRSLQYLNNTRFEAEQMKVGQVIASDEIILPSGDKVSLNGNDYTAFEPGLYTLLRRGAEQEVMAIQPDYRESRFMPSKTPSNKSIKVMGQRWQDELFLSRLGHDLWKYLLVAALILFVLELLLVKSEEWKKGGSVN